MQKINSWLGINSFASSQVLEKASENYIMKSSSIENLVSKIIEISFELKGNDYLIDFNDMLTHQGLLYA